MLKNVASQVIGAQLVSKTDGSAFTGAVTVYVTGDGGTQAAGSVGSGACTHEGNGYHTYAPSQAETNYSLVAFTFTGSGAVPVTVQVYTLPTTGVLSPTTLGRTLDVTAGGCAGVDWANVEAPTTTLGLSGTTVAAVTGAVGSVLGGLNTSAGTITTLDGLDTAQDSQHATTQGTLSTIAGYLDTEIAAILADTDELQTDWANGGRLDLLIDSLVSALANVKKLGDRVRHTLNETGGTPGEAGAYDETTETKIS